MAVRGRRRRKTCPRGADEAFAWARVPFKEAENRVAVGVSPAADHVDGAVEGGVILADRALPPVVVPALVLSHASTVAAFDRRASQRPPVLPRERSGPAAGRRRRAWWMSRGAGRMRAGAAQVVDVVGADRSSVEASHDDAELGRLVGSDLQSVECDELLADDSVEEPDQSATITIWTIGAVP